MSKVKAISKMDVISQRAHDVDLVEGRVNKAFGELNAAQQKLADAILTHKKRTKYVVKTEHKRLMEFAKGTIASDGLVIKNSKNVLAGISNMLLFGLTPNREVTITEMGKNDKGEVVQVKRKVHVKDIPTTAKSLATHASTVRQAVGMGDKRKANSGGRKTRTPRTPDGAPQKHSTAITPKDWTTSMDLAFRTVKGTKSLLTAIKQHHEQLIQEAAKMGYAMTFTKAPAKNRVVKKKAA